MTDFLYVSTTALGACPLDNSGGLFAWQNATLGASGAGVTVQPGDYYAIGVIAQAESFTNVPYGLIIQAQDTTLSTVLATASSPAGVDTILYVTGQNTDVIAHAIGFSGGTSQGPPPFANELFPTNGPTAYLYLRTSSSPINPSGLPQPPFPPSANGLTPPYIIRRILTSPIFGFQTQSLFGFTVSDSVIDKTTYNDAVQKCVDENIFIAASYTSQDSLLTILNDLLAVYGGTLAEHGGIIYFDVFRDTDVTLRTIDNDHLISDGDGVPPVTVTKGASQDGYNSVQYQFQDRAIDYKQNQVTLTDEVDIDINGYRNKVYPSKFVMTGSLASMVAERALWSNLYGRDNYDFKLGWKDSDLRPGNQVTLVDSFHPSLSKGVKVVINKLQEQTRGVFTAQATRVFDNHLTAQHGYTNTASADPGISNIIQTAGPMLDFKAYELPQEFQGSNGFLYFGYNQSTYVMGAQLYVSRDLGANYILSQDVQPYSISGRLAVDLPKRGPGHMERGVELYLFPTSGFNVATPTFVSDYTFDDATPAVRQSGFSTIIVGSEALAMEGLTLLGENHYRVEKLYRGWGGTPIAAQNSGSFWHEHVSGIFAYPITEDDIGKTIFYKISGYNFAGRLYDISSVAPQSYTVRGLRWLPRCQTPLRTFVQSAVSWTNSAEFRGRYVAVPSGGSPVVFAWSAAANNEGFGSGGAGAGGFGHFTPDFPSPTYRVDVRSTDGTGVSSFVVTTGYFNYSVLQNSADFGGFAKDVIYQVTPFTVKGDGPTSSIRSLSQIW